MELIFFYAEEFIFLHCHKNKKKKLIHISFLFIPSSSQHQPQKSSSINTHVPFPYLLLYFPSLCVLTFENTLRNHSKVFKIVVKQKSPLNNNELLSSKHGSARGYEFGRTYVVRPKGKHQATIVWLHGLGDNGSRLNGFAQLLLRVLFRFWADSLALPVRSFQLLGSCNFMKTFSQSDFLNDRNQPLCFSGFDVGEISEDLHDDIEGLDASAAHIANLLSTEPTDVKVGIGGFSMGAAIALYSTTCYALGRYGTGHPYTINLRATVGLSGWLPGWRSLRSKIESSNEAARRAASIPVILAHGIADDVVPYGLGEKSARSLAMAGFRQVMFKPYEGLGHYTVPKEMDEVVHWLASRLGLEGSR
ncbi:unnamed protein product [Thlaspi arvense]|uniref:Phospholipase/carboxylesterase/thioesterase domain-containing protein n=1 Tax=Thlaspi arvense TaxID=13288 RepID=A0AAU9S375_THLAR|nr:unnamed protein product [Thlaspi arvense]